MMRSILSGVILSALAVTAGHAAGPVDPDWPCVQRRQPALSVGQIYNRFAAKFDGMPASTMTASAGAIGLPGVRGGWASEAGMNSPFTAKAASGGANGEPNSLFTVMVLSQLSDPKAQGSKDDKGDKDDAKKGSKGGVGGQFNSVRPSLPSLDAA